MVTRIAKTAGIPRHISPHSLRHAAITNALDAGLPLRDAQILARHADPRTTEHYDRAHVVSAQNGPGLEVHARVPAVAGVTIEATQPRRRRTRGIMRALNGVRSLSLGHRPSASADAVASGDAALARGSCEREPEVEIDWQRFCLVP